MKSIKLGIFGLTSIVGIGGAFATTHKKSPKKLLAHTYYALSNGQSTYFSWTTTRPPAPLVCAASGITSYCTITTNQATKPAPGKFPQPIV